MLRRAIPCDAAQPSSSCGNMQSTYAGQVYIALLAATVVTRYRLRLTLLAVGVVLVMKDFKLSSRKYEDSRTRTKTCLTGLLWVF